MTSTSTSLGLADGKPSSKVMNPPGGRSNNIFGDYADDKSETKNGSSKTQATAAPPCEANDDAQISANKNKAKSQESSQNRLFGGPEDDEKSAGKARDEAKPEETKPEVDEKAEPDNTKKVVEESKPEDPQGSPSAQNRRGAYNPITGQDYQNSPSPKAENPQSRVRQPPGGHSSGLW